MTFGVSVVAVLVSCWEVVNGFFVQIAVPSVVVIVQLVRRRLVGALLRLGSNKGTQRRGQEGTVVGARLRCGNTGKLIAYVADLIRVRQGVATQG